LFAEDYHMLLNVAVGGGWPGNPDASTSFPQQMKVDWVRVYDHVPEPQAVTFRVDMSQENLGANDQVYVTGSFDAWSGETHALVAESNGIWSATLDLPQGIHEYKFTVNGWSGSEESFPQGSPGTLTSFDGPSIYVNRYIDVAWDGIITDANCFSSTEGCPGTGGPGCTDPDASNFSVAATSNDGSCLYPVLFSVDLSQEQAAGQTAYVNGGFNDWCGDCAPMDDADQDGVWQLVLDLPPGSHEFKFTTNAWNGLVESFDVGVPCTNTTYDGPNVYTNRSFELGAAPLELGTVCFNACSACPTVDPSYHTVTFRVQMPDPSLEAWLEVQGATYVMSDAMWGAKAVTVTVSGDAAFTYRFGTPAGALGMAWESLPMGCNANGWRTATASEDMAMEVVCFGSCGGCLGCSDPYAGNFDPIADPLSPAYLCEGVGASGCTYPSALNYDAEAVWDNGGCSFSSASGDCPDSDGDGMVGVNDVLILLSAFGNTCP
jgi:hypothetical protein